MALPEAAERPCRGRHVRAMWDAAGGVHRDARAACRDALRAWLPSAGRDEWDRGKSAGREPERWVLSELRGGAARVAAASPVRAARLIWRRGPPEAALPDARRVGRRAGAAATIAGKAHRVRWGAGLRAEPVAAAAGWLADAAGATRARVRRGMAVWVRKALGPDAGSRWAAASPLARWDGRARRLRRAVSGPGAPGARVRRAQDAAARRARL